jgi:hypothetical protein
MKKLLVLVSCVLVIQSANALLVFMPYPKPAMPLELQNIIDSLNKSSETKAIAFVFEDMEFGVVRWIWGHKSGLMTQEEANTIAMRSCTEELTKMKAMQTDGQPSYHFGQKRCELYKFIEEKKYKF